MALLTLRSGDHLRAAMRLADIRTTRELARVAGVGSSTVHALLTGSQRRAGPRVATAIAEGLGQPVDCLFTSPPVELRRRSRVRAPRQARDAGGSEQVAS